MSKSLSIYNNHVTHCNPIEIYFLTFQSRRCEMMNRGCIIQSLGFGVTIPIITGRVIATMITLICITVMLHDRHDVSNHRQLECLSNGMYQQRKLQKLRNTRRASIVEGMQWKSMLFPIRYTHRFSRTNVWNQWPTPTPPPTHIKLAKKYIAITGYKWNYCSVLYQDYPRLS